MGATRFLRNKEDLLKFDKKNQSFKQGKESNGNNQNSKE